MDLVTLREQFVKECGRYDLVVDTTDWANNGADFYLQAGQDMLDMMCKTYKSYSSVFESLDAGDWYVTFERCMNIQWVQINNATGRSKLTKKSLSWLWEEYEETISETDTGTPLYYAPARLRHEGDTDKDSLASFFRYVMDDDDAYRGIVILPPPDETIVVEVHGMFFSDALSADDVENFWTVKHPAILVLAGLYQLEQFNRNSAGMTDYLAAIKTQLDLIDWMGVEESIAEFDQIGG